MAQKTSKNLHGVEKIMLISFIIYIENENYKGQINRILKSVKRLQYKKSLIEIVIHAKAANATKNYKIQGPPLIRILPQSDLTELIKQCHGNVIYLIDENYKFPHDFLKGKSVTRLYVGSKYCQLQRGYTYPDDLKCIRTASVMKCVLSRKKLHGRWGRLNKTEILRIIYRWNELSFSRKIRLIGGWICGK